MPNVPQSTAPKDLAWIRRLVLIRVLLLFELFKGWGRKQRERERERENERADERAKLQHPRSLSGLDKCEEQQTPFFSSLSVSGTRWNQSLRECDWWRGRVDRRVSVTHSQPTAHWFFRHKSQTASCTSKHQNLNAFTDHTHPSITFPPFIPPSRTACEIFLYSYN